MDMRGIRSAIVAAAACACLAVLALPTSAGAHDILVTWGGNNLGALGIGNSSTAYELNPVPVDLTPPAGVSVTAVAVGYEHSLALLSNDTIMAWGANYYGQLGDGTHTGPESCSGAPCSTIPVPVHLTLPANVTVTAISASDMDSMALLSNGTVLGWGDNGFGALGDGTTSGPETCEAAEPCSTLPVPVSNLTDATAIWAAGFHELAVVSGGGVEEWGGGPNTTPVPEAGVTGATAVAGGEKFSLALTGGNVLAWGDDCAGELGNGVPATCNNTPAPGEVCETGSGPCPSGPYLSGVTAIQSGAYWDEALLNNGTVKTWGDRSEGELGDGTNTGPETCPGSEPCSTRPVEVTGLTGVTAIWSHDGYQSLARTSAGHLMSWGGGYLGNGGTFSDVPVEVCAVGTVGACPSGPYLDNVEVFGEGWDHSFALAEETPAHWFKKNAQLPGGGPHVAATLKGSLKLNVLGGVTTCKAAGEEAIWNPEQRER